jgi:hypothetical protein
VSDQDQKPKRSLQSEIQKRKTQEIQRQIETNQKQRTQGRSVSDTNKPGLASKPNGQAPSVLRPAVPSSTDARRVTQTFTRASDASVTAPRRFTRSQIRLLAGVLVTVLILTGVMGPLLLATNATVTLTPTFAPLPIVQASHVIDHLKTAGWAVNDIREFPVPNELWHGHQELQFEVSQGPDKGLVLLITYASNEQKVPDLALSTTSDKFKQWRVITLSNVIVLISPETSQALQNQLSVELTKLLVVPYRPFLSSPTPNVTGTP